MSNSKREKIVTISFAIILIGMFLLNVIVKDKEVSISERRKLATMPDINLKTIFESSTMNKIEDYTVDQMVFRDAFRAIKLYTNINVFHQKDNNGLFEKDGAIYKLEYPLVESNVEKSSDKLKNIYNTYLKGMDVYLAIIPDRNYYLEDEEYLKMDYERLRDIMKSKLTEVTYIDIWECLDLEDYYKTDIHWKQENLQKVVSEVITKMGLEYKNVEYNIINKGDFYGAYYGQYGKKLQADTLNVLENATIKECITYNYETKKLGKVYDEKASQDKYDIYLSGAAPLISVTNPNADTNKELLLFRDSFGSSLAPLLTEYYSKITLIDIRYISSSIIDEYINFENQDVIFLYSSLVLNQNLFK